MALGFLVKGSALCKGYKGVYRGSFKRGSIRAIGVLMGFRVEEFWGSFKKLLEVYRV